MKQLKLPCPVCGEDPEHGKTNKGYIIFCNDHPRISAFGQTLEEAEANWNRQNWEDAFSDEEDEEEFDEDDSD